MNAPIEVEFVLTREEAARIATGSIGSRLVALAILGGVYALGNVVQAHGLAFVGGTMTMFAAFFGVMVVLGLAASVIRQKVVEAQAGGDHSSQPGSSAYRTAVPHGVRHHIRWNSEGFDASVDGNDQRFAWSSVVSAEWTDRALVLSVAGETRQVAPRTVTWRGGRGVVTSETERFRYVVPLRAFQGDAAARLRALIERSVSLPQ